MGLWTHKELQKRQAEASEMVTVGRLLERELDEDEARRWSEDDDFWRLH